MKALSLKQPWANLVSHGLKIIEIRKWNTNFRGPFLIHASKTIDKTFKGGHVGLEPRGELIAIAKLVHVVKYDDFKEWNKARQFHLNWHATPDDLPLYGFVLTDIDLIKPIPFKGQLNFFETKLTWMDIRLLKNIEYLKCRKCGHLNELELGWRSTGDDNDTHDIICKECKTINSINNRNFKSKYLFKGIC